MISILNIILIVLAHLVGDWLWQSREMALTKSSSFKVLIEHVSRVMIMQSIPGHFIFKEIGFEPLFIWIGLNFTLHAIQDWFIWRIAAKKLLKSCKTKAEAYETRTFWNVVGVDQALHYIVYFSTLIPLIKM